MITNYKNGETLLYYPPGVAEGIMCWYVKPDNEEPGRHIIMLLGRDELTTHSVTPENLFQVGCPAVPMKANCTNCGQEFMRKGSNDSWICDACFYGERDIKCTVCGLVTNDFYSPKSGVVCNTCVEKRA